MSSNHGGLTPLSDSHIHNIFQFFEDDELYDFSMTSRRMHKLALSLLLSRCGIQDPLHSVDVDFEDLPNALRILRVALFVPSIQQLSVRFSTGMAEGMNWTLVPFPPLSLGQLQATAERLSREIDRLRRLLKKLRSVDKITLIFPGSLAWNLRDMNIERSTADTFSWSQMLFFLHEIVEKPCVSLTVEASTFWRHAYTVPRAAKATGGARYIFRKMLRSNQEDMSALARWDRSKYRPQKPPHTAIRGRSSLTTFSIKSTLLLFPGSAGWTFSVLKHSPLTTLHISDLSISRSDWEQIAVKLADAVPNLLELDFDDRQISPDCLMWLLNRLQRLTSLALGAEMSVYLTHPRIFPPFSNWYLPAFQNLTRLTAPTSYAMLFLMRRNPLPAVTSLVLPPIDIAQIATRHHKSFYVHQPGIIRRLREINHPLYPLPVAITLGSRGNDIWHLVFRHVDTSLALKSENLESLREVTHLVLENFNSMIDAQCTSRWLRLFPSLQHVSWTDPDAWRATQLDLPTHAREISRACPVLEAITVQGVRHDISSILTPGEILETSTEVMKLCDLPTEVLLMIFDLLYAELFHLSLLCRRLHFLALPLFLAKNSITDPCDVTALDLGILNEPHSPVLSALMVALFVPSIKHLACAFPNPAYIHRHFNALRRVTRLIARLATVEKLSLEFAFNTYRLGLVNWEGYDECAMWEGCYSALDDLLNALRDKSCTSLTVIGSPAPNSSFRSLIPQPPLSNVTSITTLHLDVDVDSSSWWTLMALKNSLITSLTLTATSYTNLEYIAKISAALTMLSIDGEGASKSGVLTYLNQCPNLTILSLGYHLSLYDDSPQSAVVEVVNLRLKSLTDLTAPVTYLSHFFSTNDCVPALQHLRILLPAPDDVNWTLTSVIERVYDLRSAPLAITVEVVYTLTLTSISRSANSLSFLGGKWRHAARYVTGLAVQCHPELINPADPRYTDGFPALVHWLGLFNTVRDISIQGLVASEPPVGFGESLGRALLHVQVVRLNERIIFER
jgi:hypothetical protein